MSADRSASVLARLLNRSRSTGENYNLLLSRFAIERLLYRLSVSPHAGNFVLKGALLFALWYDTPHRPTKDADLLGFGADDADTLRSTFTAICAIDADDGVRYDPSGMRIAPIREDNVYGGLRLNIPAFIGSARLPVQVDIGFGDAITPAPKTVTYPTLLDDLAAPSLRAYPVYTVIAEKLHAMVVLGMNNSRMKDFFDLAVIARTSELDGATLVSAIRATFARRNTSVPTSVPAALTADFSSNPIKAQQWRAFVTKAGLRGTSLDTEVEALALFLCPALAACSLSGDFESSWIPVSCAWRGTVADQP
ncbi:MAG: nucleotidyl transferase AbiEii/AbiGii toxin family protein [Burkholderiales bacterium]|nr:nucleotidyl transferase AbiEii/AbiGii toxin family protein [Burkholderiales bacterium]